ncbi:MAG TPA: hypothetical protein VGN17_05135 [Bryobacteraceae bacterium]|jgi:hypothetical protein
MKWFNILLVLICVALIGCKSTVPTAPAVPASADPVAPYLGTITTGAHIATGVFLQFGVNDAAERTLLANQIYSAASGVYSLTDGKVPTPEQVAEAVASFHWTGNVGIYAQFSGTIAEIYSAYYPQIVGNPKYAIEVLSALAQGCEQAASAYSTVTQGPQ